MLPAFENVWPCDACGPRDTGAELADLVMHNPRDYGVGATDLAMHVNHVILVADLVMHVIQAME